MQECGTQKDREAERYVEQVMWILQRERVEGLRDIDMLTSSTAAKRRI